MARAMWKGTLRIDEHEVPVKFYAAAVDRTVRFRLLDESTGRPIGQRMVDPTTDDEIPHEEIRRGVPLDDGRFVVLDDEDLETLEPESSRAVEIDAFYDPSAIAHPWYDRPYHLGPDGDAAAYFALVDALEAEGKEGLARWTMRKKEYVGALRAVDGHLVMVTLRHADEVVPASALEAPGGREPDAKELEMARRLVDALAGPFDAEEFGDEYRTRVEELIEAKAEGRTIRLKPRKERRPEEDLLDSLRSSLEAAEGRKSA